MNEKARQYIETQGVTINVESEKTNCNAAIDFEREKTNGNRVDAWRKHLIRVITKDGLGGPKSILANAVTALRLAPEWTGVLAYNEFSLYTVTKKPAPWQTSAGANWTDYDDSRTCEWLHHEGILVTSNVAAEAVQTVAMENRFHPVRDYLNGLEWDNVGRIDMCLSRYLGAKDTAFVRAVGARWLISAVARIFRPGCQADHTLHLEGPQGIGKSTALRVLAGDAWFSDHISDLGSKDSRLELHGKWVFEMAELDKVRRGELERVKAFLTARTDHFRKPYGRRVEDVPRTNVFAATANDETPLVDETGNRRFWPVRCGEIKTDALTADRDQLWAEALQRYREGGIWWLDSAELNEAAAAEQEDRFECGVWDDVILAWIDDPKQRSERDHDIELPVEPFDSSRERVTVTDVLIHAVGKPLDHSSMRMLGGSPDQKEMARETFAEIAKKIIERC